MAIIDETAFDSAHFVRGHLYVRRPAPLYFPSEDEEPVGETSRHLDIRTALHLLLKGAFAKTATLGSEQFVYWDRTNPRRCVCPDIFVKRGVPHAPIDVWKTWERGIPELAVEIVSAWDRSASEWEEKLERYRASGIPELVRFDHEDEERPLRIWDDVDSDLVERAANDPNLRYCQALELWWTVVREDDTLTLRLARDRDGRELIPTPLEEVRRQAEEARAKAQAEIEQLKAELARARGDNPK